MTIAHLGGLAVIFSVQYIEHWRSRNPNGVVLFYWLFFVIAHAIKVRSYVSRQIYDSNLPVFVVFTISLGLAILEFVLEYLVPKKQSAYDALGDEDECPLEYADIFSVITFAWLTPLMKYGYRNYLTQDDLWNLRRRDSTRVTGNAMQTAWNSQLQKKGKPSIWIAMVKAFGGPYLRGAIIKTASDCLAFIQPQLLRLLIRFVDSYRTPEPQPVARGVVLALAMFATSICQTCCLHQYFQRVFEVGMRVKSSLTAMIYTKALKLSNEGRAAKTTGDIVNHMAVDQQRLADLTQFGQQTWSAPFQITLCLISLYNLVGISMLAGLAAMIIMVPLNGVVARLMKKYQIEQMKNKDTRARLMVEIMNNMKSIKLYDWSRTFMNKLSHVRNEKELNTLRKIGAVSAFANFTWSTTPFLVSCSTFAVFVLTSDTPLTTDIVFPALTLFNLLTFPLSILPMVITSIIEATVAANRLRDFFLAEELQPDAVTIEEAPTQDGEETVCVKNGAFTWDRYEGRNVLENINFTAHKGELTCILGRVGAGKSSMLQALLGDLYKTQGEVIIRGKVAYVAQQSWIMNANVKENIVFGHKWDPEFYQLTLEACALLDDMKALPDGDLTQVGERGISLSGGQKARLTLARAVYARADIYVLDDCLSAVDSHVGRHLINRVLGPQGLLKSKTRILATNAITVLKDSDFIVLLRNNTIFEKGTYEQLMAMKGEIATLVKTNSRDEDETDSASEFSIDESMSPNGLVSATDMEEAEEAREAVGTMAPIKAGGGGNGRKTSFATLRRASTATFHGPRGKITDEEGGLKSKQAQENIEQGKVKWNVYKEYAKTSNVYAVGLYLTALLLAQTSQVGGSFWLKNWSETNERNGSNSHVGRFIGVYFAFGIGAATLVLLQTLILWIFCSIEVNSHVLQF